MFTINVKVDAQNSLWSNLRKLPALNHIRIMCATSYAADRNTNGCVEDCKNMQHFISFFFFTVSSRIIGTLGCNKSYLLQNLNFTLKKKKSLS